MRVLYRTGMTLLGFSVAGNIGGMLAAAAVVFTATTQQWQAFATVLLYLVPTVAAYAALKATADYVRRRDYQHLLERDFIVALIGGGLLYGPYFIVVQGWQVIAYGSGSPGLRWLVQVLAVAALALGAVVAARLWGLTDAADRPDAHAGTDDPPVEGGADKPAE